MFPHKFPSSKYESYFKVNHFKLWLILMKTTKCSSFTFQMKLSCSKHVIFYCHSLCSFLSFHFIVIEMLLNVVLLSSSISNILRVTTFFTWLNFLPMAFEIHNRFLLFYRCHKDAFLWQTYLCHQALNSWVLKYSYETLWNLSANFMDPGAHIIRQDL